MEYNFVKNRINDSIQIEQIKIEALKEINGKINFKRCYFRIITKERTIFTKKKLIIKGN